MPYDSPMKKKGSACMQLKDHKGKPSGLMMEGSVAYQEETKKVEEAKAKKLDKKQEIKETKDLLTEMPVDNKASAMEMSPYKMGHESPAEFTGMSGGSALHTKHDKGERSGKAKETPTEKLEGITVTGDASKVGAYGKELDKIFSGIQSTLDKGGYSSSRAQHQAGLGYGTKASKEFGRLQEMREKEGVIPTLRYIKRRQRD